jgi:hypothetical protein
VDLDASFGSWLLVLLAGYLNAENVDWNLQLSTRRGKILRNYADEKSCLIFGPDFPTTTPFNPSATPDVLDIVITRHLPSFVRLTTYSTLSSGHLDVLIGTMCRSFFQQPPDRADVRRTVRSNFQAHLEAEIPFNPELHDMAFDLCVEKFSGII